MDRPFLIGKKIYLRPLDIDDLEGRYLQWVNNEEITKHLGTLYFPFTKDRLRSYLIEQLSNPSVAFFAVIEKKSGRHIGNAKLGPIDWINRHAELGRMIGEKIAQGKGYGTEITKLLLKYGFRLLNLHKIFSVPSVKNISSIKSNKNSGLEIEAIIKKHKYEDGSYVDVCFMSITKEKYFNLEKKI